MHSRKIKFAHEFCFNAEYEYAEKQIKTGIIDYQLLNNDLFIRNSNNDFVGVIITSNNMTVLTELRNSYGRSLLRADKINGEYIYFTLLEFSGMSLFDKDNPLRIIVDQAVALDLKVNGFSHERAADEIYRQIILNEIDRYAFAYAGGNHTDKLEFIGERYTFSVVETPQKYLHIVQIRKRSNKDRIDSPIVLLKGTIDVVNELTDQAILTAKADKEYDTLISSDEEFINLWDVYNELEIESIKQQASEMGFLKYRGFQYANGMVKFSLVKSYTRKEFCSDNFYYAAIESIDEENPMNYNHRSATVIGTEIDYSCINTPIFIVKEDRDTTKTIPEDGYLVPSISGSVIQSKRREIAKKNILSNKCQLPGLKNIIQGGAQVGAIGRKQKPVSSRLEREVFGDKGHHFTEKQKKAIDVAINTPDIAIIQGPPGTGKTTIIKAIVKRIDELWHSKAKILITSTQHDAVDNAVEEIRYGGVPVNRVYARRGKDDNSYLIYDWIDHMIDSCENWLSSREGNERSTVRNIFEKLIRIESSGDYNEAYSLLKDCFKEMQLLSVSPELNLKCTRILGELGIASKGTNDKDQNRMLDLLKKQRFDKESFLEDGLIQLKQLEQYMKYESDVELEIPDYWRKLKKIKTDCPELQELLLQYKNDIAKLEFICLDSTEPASEYLKNDVIELINEIRIELIGLGNDSKTALNSLIWGFKQKLTNSYNVEQLIKAYSKINAATCQQAANPYLSRSMAGFEEVYDFVIIDEAARSNPLDLLIPMSMGKRIILVGDHKQLPHMVQRDVVQEVAKKSPNKNVERVLEESLFMRLYTSVSENDFKLGISRTAMLSEQYRMHPDICQLVNVFYDGKLETLCTREAKEHNLGLYNEKAIVWIDMPLCEKYPAEKKRQSISRKCEVDQIQQELAKILVQNMDFTVGVITFYSEQARLLNDMVHSFFPGDVHRISVGTVDSFQGKEFDVVFLSVVRSNKEKMLNKRVGFLDNDNRLCVAFSRAKRLLVAIGDSQTVAYNGDIVYVKALYEMYKKAEKIKGYK